MPAEGNCVNCAWEALNMFSPKVFAFVGVWTPTCEKSALVRAPILFQLPQVTPRIIILQFIDIAEKKSIRSNYPGSVLFSFENQHTGFARRTSSARKNSWAGYGWVISAPFFSRYTGELTPKIIYFHYLKKSFLIKVSKKHIFYYEKGSTEPSTWVLKSSSASFRTRAQYFELCFIHAVYEVCIPWDSIDSSVCGRVTSGIATLLSVMYHRLINHILLFMYYTIVMTHQSAATLVWRTPGLATSLSATYDRSINHVCCVLLFMYYIGSDLCQATISGV